MKNDWRWYKTVALSRYCEQVAPKSTTLNLYVKISLAGSKGFSGHKKRVLLRSRVRNPTCRKAFAISAVHAYFCKRNLNNTLHKSLINEGPLNKHSFSEGEVFELLALQSKTIRMGVVFDSDDCMM